MGTRGSAGKRGRGSPTNSFFVLLLVYYRFMLFCGRCCFTRRSLFLRSFLLFLLFLCFYCSLFSFYCFYCFSVSICFYWFLHERIVSVASLLCFHCFYSEESFGSGWNCPEWCSGGRRPLIAGRLSLQRLGMDSPLTRPFWPDLPHLRADPNQPSYRCNYGGWGQLEH